MPSNTTVQDLAEISQYLWTSQIAQDNAFSGGSINNGRNIALYNQRKALDYGLQQSLSGVTGVATMVYSLCGAKLQLANQVLSAGSGGVVPNPSGGSSSLAAYRSQFVVGSPDSLFTNGGTVATIYIGMGNNFLSNSIQVSLDQSILPQNNPNYISYTVSYSLGTVTITLNQPAQTGQLYIITFDYFDYNIS
jgi:hypothetical protein